MTLPRALTALGIDCLLRNDGSMLEDEVVDDTDEEGGNPLSDEDDGSGGGDEVVGGVVGWTEEGTSLGSEVGV